MFFCKNLVNKFLFGRNHAFHKTQTILGLNFYIKYPKIIPYSEKYETRDF